VIASARQAARCIGYGASFRDKLVISFHLGLYLLFPLATLARRLGHGLPDPMRLFRAYRCRCADGVFECPTGQGPYFLGCEPGYEEGVMQVVRQMDGGTFLDVGANIGFITVRAARILAGRGRVIALEPHPGRFASLQRNIDLNELTNATALPYAAGSSKGDATIYEPLPTLGPHPIDVSMSDIGGQAIKIETRTIDDILEALPGQKVALIKIDVEGFELEVIKGMLQTLRNFRPDVIFEALDSSALSLTTGMFRELEYSVHDLDGMNYLAIPTR
jgi:FkbM family methyltransferase